MALHFTIPGKPSAWQRAAHFVDKRSGRMVAANPKGMAEAQKMIAWAAKAAQRGAPPLTGPLRLEVLCVYAVPASWPKWKQAAAMAGAVWKTSAPDHDNLTKQVGDALNGVAYVDDAQIVKSSVAKRYGQPERTEVRLSRVEGLSDDATQLVFQEWLQVHGNQAQIKAAGRWLVQQGTQPSLPLAPQIPRNTLTEKGR